MPTYAKAELEETLRAIISTINKCKKIMPKLKENSAQNTLLKRRIKALQISVDLINKELSGSFEEEK
jgi:phage-related minor tail protein